MLQLKQRTCSWLEPASRKSGQIRAEALVQAGFLAFHSDSSSQPGLTSSGRATFCLRIASYFSLSLRSASDSFIVCSQELSIHDYGVKWPLIFGRYGLTEVFAGQVSDACGRRQSETLSRQEYRPTPANLLQSSALRSSQELQTWGRQGPASSLGPSLLDTMMAPTLWFRQQRCDLLSPSLNGLRPAHVPKHTRLHIRNRDQQPGHFQLQAWSGRYLVPSWVKMP